MYLTPFNTFSVSITLNSRRAKELCNICYAYKLDDMA